MPKSNDFNYGETAYSFVGIASTSVQKYDSGLVTILDPTGHGGPPSGLVDDYWLCEYQPYKKPLAPRWVQDRFLRDAKPDDFNVGDIITENCLSICDLEIIEIEKPVNLGFLSSFTSNAPIKAEQLDELKMRTGTVFQLDPHECILKEPVTETTKRIQLDPPVDNNQGRVRCWWCNTETKKILGFHMDVYDVCPCCKK